jgi:hypothetical protein
MPTPVPPRRRPTTAGSGSVPRGTSRWLAARWCLVPREPGQDLVGVGDPDKRLAALIPGVAEAADRGDQLLHAGEVTPTERLARDDREEHLDQVEP